MSFCRNASCPGQLVGLVEHFVSRGAMDIEGMGIKMIEQLLESGLLKGLADIYRLDRRGYLRPGFFADVAVIDPDGFAPRADYMNPRELSVGVRKLYVNGTLAVDDSRATGATAGRALLRPVPATGCPVVD